MTAGRHLYSVLGPLVVVLALLLVEMQRALPAGTVLGSFEVLAELTACMFLLLRPGSRYVRVVLGLSFLALAFGDASWTLLYYVKSRPETATSTELIRIPYIIAGVTASLALVPLIRSTKLSLWPAFSGVFIALVVCVRFAVMPFASQFHDGSGVENGLLAANILTQLVQASVALVLFMHTRVTSWSLLSGSFVLIVFGDWAQQIARASHENQAFGLHECLWAYAVFAGVACVVVTPLRAELLAEHEPQPGGLETVIKIGIVAASFVFTIVCSFLPDLIGPAVMVIIALISSFLSMLSAPAAHYVREVAERPPDTKAAAIKRVLSAVPIVDLQRALQEIGSPAHVPFRPIRTLDPDVEADPRTAIRAALVDVFARGDTNTLMEALTRAYAVNGFESLLTAMPDIDAVVWGTEMLSNTRRVCRIFVDDTFKGTGFLVSRDIVLSCHHVLQKAITDKAEGNRIRFEFGHAIGAGASFNVTARRNFGDWHLDSSEPVKDEDAANPRPDLDHLDHALVRLAQAVDRIDEAPRGWISLASEPGAENSTGVFVLQHPAGNPLKLEIDSKSEFRPSSCLTRVRYGANFTYGSSGSPCFNRRWRLVALHHWGDPRKPPAYNQGIRVDAICRRVLNKPFAKELGLSA
jgi:hypothetical protein